MKAIGLFRYGGPEVLGPVELPEPHASPGQVRVWVRAAGVNPVDSMLRQGLRASAYRDVEPPFVPGLEVAGTVDEVGAGVEVSAEVALGLDVVGFVNSHGSHGGYSAYVVLPPASVLRMPAGVSLPEAASFLNNVLTAQNALDALALAEGSTLLVTGAAGAVGGYLTQLASRQGLRVIALASASDGALVRSFGAQEFIARGADAVAAAWALAPSGVDAVADAALLRSK